GLPEVDGTGTGRHTRRRRCCRRSPLERKELAVHGHDSHEHDHGSHNQDHVAELPRETEGLPEAGTSELVELADGDEFELEIKPVKRRIGDGMVRMLTYNGSVPGPTLKVPQGATITVHVTNHGDLDATVHWHGLRLENR